MTPNTYSIVNELLRGSVTKEQAIAWIEEGRQHAFKNGRAAERIENGEYAEAQKRALERAEAELSRYSMHVMVPLADYEKQEKALGSLQEMLAKQVIGLSDDEGGGLLCSSCGALGDPERHDDDCIVQRGLGIIDAALAPKDTRPGPTYCDKCDGTGWTEGGQGGAIGATCRHCKGHGIAPYQGDVDYEKPAVRRESEIGTTCATCNGIGAVPADGLTRNCPECAGSGKAENAIGTTRRHELTAAVINAHPLTIGAPMTDEQIRAWAFRDECLIDLCEKLEERCEELAAENRSLSQGIIQHDAAWRCTAKPCGTIFLDFAKRLTPATCPECGCPAIRESVPGIRSEGPET